MLSVQVAPLVIIIKQPKICVFPPLFFKNEICKFWVTYKFGVCASFVDANPRACTPSVRATAGAEGQFQKPDSLHAKRTTGLLD